MMREETLTTPLTNDNNNGIGGGSSSSSSSKSTFNSALSSTLKTIVGTGVIALP